jgi:hypothetical protein
MYYEIGASHPSLDLSLTFTRTVLCMPLHIVHFALTNNQNHLALLAVSYMRSISNFTTPSNPLSFAAPIALQYFPPSILRLAQCFRNISTYGL